MPEWSSLAAALAIGFLGSSHCIGMCGGISGALGLAVPGQKPAWRRLLGYSAGRVASYTLMGLLVGLLGAYLATDIANSLAPLRLAAGVMLIAMALYLADWWRGLTRLERAGAVLWRGIQPLSRKLLPVSSTPQAVALGALWGWLPCGLVYSALTFALAQGSGGQAALSMLAFGVGTLPAVLATGFAATRLREIVRRSGVRLTMAALVLLFGIWTIWGALGHRGHGAHSNHSAGHIHAPEHDVDHDSGQNSAPPHHSEPVEHHFVPANSSQEEERDDRHGSHHHNPHPGENSGAGSAD
ncbi:sulfite exporter TauE/SafE family protein [Microbulbifer sp. SH-1]|uniref:sulfite exporter TauE/SafE family protein n=1 Tax=Microbulbifer sp. SH-1 TaxID=2681547 RepID=UPI00140CDCCC|nr:sulfite exporter TauE/SafE family protein [Microbulbifer sp. SH-1]QIL88781.1 sulfite exporter TauE/SafE family protein [Microbulbifer sp. SH-1]